MNLLTKIKKGLLAIYGPADLDTTRDPIVNLEREEQGEPKPASDQAKDWDRG